VNNFELSVTITTNSSPDIRVLPWPTLSPDMSPIEQLFDELSRRARRRQNAPEALQELSDAFVHE
jgi:transposase